LFAEVDRSRLVAAPDHLQLHDFSPTTGAT
jgi:hypothetical protein